MPGISHFLYDVFQTNAHIFADEVDKYQLLARLSDYMNEVKPPWRIAAFVLTDDTFHVLVASLEDGNQVLQTELCQILGGYLEEMEHQGASDAAKEDVSLPRFEVTSQVLTDTRSVVERCLAMHMIPEQLGLSDRAGNYFWSSFQTYREAFHWNFVEESCIYDLIDEEDVRARQVFKRMHRADQLRSRRDLEALMHYLS